MIQKKTWDYIYKSETIEHLLGAPEDVSTENRNEIMENGCDYASISESPLPIVFYLTNSVKMQNH